MNTISKLAVVGPGLIGKKHIENIKKNKLAELSAIIAPISDENIAIAYSNSVPLFPTIDSLMAKQVVDGIIIASPNEFHFEQASYCIKNAIPVLIEKPITDNLKSAEQLLSLLIAYNTKVLIGHHRTHSEVIRHAKTIIENNLMGDIVTVHGAAQYFKPPGYYSEAPWRREHGGGPLLINFIHEIGIFRYLLGEILAVQAIVSNRARGFEVEDSAVINIEFASGVIGSFVLSDTVVSSQSWELTSGENSFYPRYEDSFCYSISGTKGSLNLPQLDLFSYQGEPSWGNSIHRRRIDKIDNDPLSAQLSHFIEIIQQNVPPIVTLRDGLYNLKVIQKIKESSVSGKKIYI